MYDNDEPGREGAVKARNILLRLNTPNIQQVQPPEGYKDWNAFHIDAQGTDKLYKYVTENIEKMNFSFFVSQALSTD